MHFRHERGKDVHAPGFYLHLESGGMGLFGGLGIWHPDNQTLGKIRDAIVDKPDEWQAAITHKPFTDLFSLGGNSLKRPPKGYDKEHPLIEDLKRKDFVASTEFTLEQVCAPDFVDQYADVCKRGAPLMRFLTTAIGLAW